MKKIYYAHHMWKYYTKIEEYELNLIKKCLGNRVKIFNPSMDFPKNRPDSEIMPLCFQEIKHSDGLVFSAVNGVVGKGVVSEVELAKKLNLPIYYLFENTLTKCVPTFKLTNECNFMYATVEYEKENLKNLEM